MIHPSPRLLILFAVGLVPAALPSMLGGSLWGLWAAWCAITVVLLAVDALLMVREDALTLQVAHPAFLYIGNEGDLGVRVESSGATVLLELLPEMDPLLEPQLSIPVRIPAGGHGECTFRLVPKRRGKHFVHAIWLRWTGPFGLARRIERRAVEAAVAVVPDLGTARAAAIRFFGARESGAGAKIERFLGEGTEFDSLREFVPGFDPRALSWKASARHRRLLVRQYHAEKDHQVFLAIDTGRLMAEPLEGIARVDHAVTAALLLAYVATRTGDRVGMHAFDSSVRIHLPAGAGPAAFQRIQRRSADVEYSSEETNFTLGLTDLLTRIRRRSLVIVFTDFVDSTSAELMLDNLKRLARRHLVLFVALRDSGLASIADRVPDTVDDLHRGVVAADLLRERSLVLAHLRRAGVHCIDTPPSQFSAEVLNRYLDLRRRELV